MNDELIKRIDHVLEHVLLAHALASVLHDCRAELKRLATELKESRTLSLKLAQDRETQDAENESLRNQNTALDAKLAEYSERKYVPMTDVEWDGISKKWQSDSVECMKKCQSIPPFHLYIEAVVIRRAGLEVES